MTLFVEDGTLSKEDEAFVHNCRAENAERQNVAGKRMITREWMNTEHCC
jgi:hypothetical protein